MRGTNSPLAEAPHEVEGERLDEGEKVARTSKHSPVRRESKLKGSVPKGQVPHVPIATRNEGALTEPRRGKSGNLNLVLFPHSLAAFEAQSLKESNGSVPELKKKTEKRQEERGYAD